MISVSRTMVIAMASELSPAPDNEDLEQQLHALSCERRREVLAILHNTDGALSITDLATKIAAKECDDTVLTTTDGGSTTLQQQHSDHADQVKIPLHHGHLPRLDEAGFVDYDLEEKRVALAASLEESQTLEELP